MRLGLWLWSEEYRPPIPLTLPSGSSSEADVEDVEEVEDDLSRGLTAMHVVRVYTVSVGKDSMPSVVSTLHEVPVDADVEAEVGEMGYAIGLAVVDERSTRAAS